MPSAHVPCQLLPSDRLLINPLRKPGTLQDLSDKTRFASSKSRRNSIPGGKAHHDLRLAQATRVHVNEGALLYVPPMVKPTVLDARPQEKKTQKVPLAYANYTEFTSRL